MRGILVGMAVLLWNAPVGAADDYTEFIVRMPNAQVARHLQQAHNPPFNICTPDQTPEACFLAVTDLAYYLVTKFEYRHLSDVGASLIISTDAQTRRLLALQTEVEALRQQVQGLTTQLQSHEQQNEALRESMRSELWTAVHQTQARVERLEQP